MNTLERLIKTTPNDQELGEKLRLIFGIMTDKEKAQYPLTPQECYQDLENNRSLLNLNALAKEIHQNNIQKGFYDEPHSTGERIALMHSELSEALEADRKNLMDDKLPHRTGIEVEYADCIIRILDDSANKGYDIHGAVLEKMAYNTTRPYKHGKKY